MKALLIIPAALALAACPGLEAVETAASVSAAGCEVIVVRHPDTRMAQKCRALLALKLG